MKNKRKYKKMERRTYVDLTSKCFFVNLSLLEHRTPYKKGQSSTGNVMFTFQFSLSFYGPISSRLYTYTKFTLGICGFSYRLISTLIFFKSLESYGFFLSRKNPWLSREAYSLIRKYKLSILNHLTELILVPVIVA